MKIYCTGQRSFANRGCEAIVRSTARLFHDCGFEGRFIVPSEDAIADSNLWSNHHAAGCDFAEFGKTRFLQRLLQKGIAYNVPYARRYMNRLPLPSRTLDDIAQCDGFLSIGGDLYSMDYGIPVRIMSMDAEAMNRGKKGILWASSIGPFDSKSVLENIVISHLRRFERIVVREKMSWRYLTAKGLDNVMLGGDPAFCLEAEPSEFFTELRELGPLFGINLSPIAYNVMKANGRDVVREACRLIYHLVNSGYVVVLIPHVINHRNGVALDDFAILSQLLRSVIKDVGQSVIMAPRSLNAPQLKQIIGQCRIVMGARTHATIAAFSSGVPTISLAYSIKAKGLNVDMFGHGKLVLDMAECDYTQWIEIIRFIENNYSSIHAQIRSASEEQKKRAMWAADSSLKALKGVC